MVPEDIKWKQWYRVFRGVICTVSWDGHMQGKRSGRRIGDRLRYSVNNVEDLLRPHEEPSRLGIGDI